jgi:hypothetical protein
MSVETHTMNNRYGDQYTFTTMEDGNIQWKGEFKYCRFGWPNVYGDAYREYLNDNEGKEVLSLEEFKEEVHRSIYELDDKGLERYVGPCEISEKYSKYIFSNQNMINMVDPSGGPYLATGMEFMGKTIKEFKPNPEGYLIITE